MSEPKWTPGPWRISETWRPPIGFYKPDRDRLNADGNIFWGYSISGSNEHGGSILPTLAAVHNFPDNIEANAHLIAAAPEMDAALEAALELEALIVERMTCSDESQRRSCQSEIDGTTEMIRAALAKARGETE